MNALTGTRVVVGTISRAALTREIGSYAVRSAVGYPTRFPPPVLVPMHEDLQEGDIILSSRRGYFSSRIEKIQRQYCQLDCVHWTHAMLYVGELHVVESNKHYSLTSGVQVIPLTNYSSTHDLVVLRYRDAEFKEKRRQNIARHALLHRSINRRKYDMLAAWHALMGSRPNQKRHATHINCSEFVLECFAVAGPFLLDEWVAVTKQQNHFFFPAHFAADPRFDRIELRYRELET